MNHVRVWSNDPERFKKAIFECGLEEKDVVSLFISSKGYELVLREDWPGDLDKLQTRLEETEITRPLRVRLETENDKGEELGL